MPQAKLVQRSSARTAQSQYAPSAWWFCLCRSSRCRQQVVSSICLWQTGSPWTPSSPQGAFTFPTRWQVDIPSSTVWPVKRYVWTSRISADWSALPQTFSL